MITHLCPICCKFSSSAEKCGNARCPQRASFTQQPFYYLRLPILPQLTDILRHTDALQLDQQHRPANTQTMDDIYDGSAYQHIIQQQQGTEFLTFLMNVDGVQVAKSSTSSLWIITLVINEIKRTDRFQMKNVIIGGIVSTRVKPKHRHIQALMSPIVTELLSLEKQHTFQIKRSGSFVQAELKCFLLASCCDKPAQSLVQGISEPIGAYGCGRCEMKGIIAQLSYRIMSGLVIVVLIVGVTVPVKKDSTHKIRVFPLVLNHKKQPRLRTNDTYDKFIKNYKKNSTATIHELRDKHLGHVSPCVLRDLTYFDVGTSFLSDSLHNVYHGVMVCFSCTSFELDAHANFCST